MFAARKARAWAWRWSRALAELHGGEALIDSTLGEGTIVRVRLPNATVSEKSDRLDAAPEIAARPPKQSELRGAA